MNYIEVNITISPVEPWRDLISADLGGLNYESFVETKKGVQAFIRVEDYSKNALDLSLDNYKDDCETSYSIKEIESVNWNEEWEKNFNPIVVSDKCIIRATFHRLDKDYKYDIVIDPKMSFGTGHHATTYLMIEELLTMNIEGQNVLDMGCGTSVLAILASKLGAKEILAIDYDEWSVNNSIENVALNNVENIVVKEGSNELLHGNRFNLILANINLNVLLAQISSYVDVLKEGGSVLFSGVLEQDRDKLLVAIDESGLSVKEAKQKDKWIMLHCVK